MIRFRYDKEVFLTILSKQSRLSDKINPDIRLVLGNIHARTEIIKICNPYCQPCLESHAALEQVLKNNRDVRIRIIYNITDDNEDLRSMPVKHFFAIWRETPDLLRGALIEWYSSKNLNYENFAAKYPLKSSLKLQEAEIKRMYKWCIENGLDDRSPVYLIDGYYLPEIYKAADLQSVL
ncbi:MAG: hypothetical protein JWR38_4794 [Mucilaginibacter sp.]|nr:hypothetical protein [Mucilaginibacter sp.]